MWAAPFAVGPEQQSVLQVNRSPLLGSRGLAPALRHQPSGSNLKVAASSFGQYVSQMSFTRSDPGVRLVLAGPDLRGRRAGRTTTRRRQPPRALRPVLLDSSLSAVGSPERQAEREVLVDRSSRKASLRPTSTSTEVRKWDLHDPEFRRVRARIKVRADPTLKGISPRRPPRSYDTTNPDLLMATRRPAQRSVHRRYRPDRRCRT